MHHYKESGLPNHYLLNGYKEINTPYGEAVIIENVEYLHKAIATWIVESRRHLVPEEFRFIRKFLDYTQAQIALLVGVDEQSVRRWERENVPLHAALFIKYLFRERMANRKPIAGFADRLQQLQSAQSDGNDLSWKFHPRRQKPSERWAPQEVVTA